MKRGKLSKTEEIVNYETIRKVCEERCKNLRILELDKLKEQEMADILRTEYM